MALIACASSSAQLILQINVSNPAAVTFTATSANSSIIFNGTSITSAQSGTTPLSFQDGISLLGFFRNPLFATSFGSSIGSQAEGSSTLGPSLNSGIFFDATCTWDEANFSSESSTAYDLNVFQNGGSAALLFDTTHRGLTGVMTVDFSSNTADLPLPGASGNIIIPYGNGTIGTWSVVSAIPEPSTYAALFGALALGVVSLREYRRRRPRAA